MASLISVHPWHDLQARRVAAQQPLLEQQPVTMSWLGTLSERHLNHTNATVWTLSSGAAVNSVSDGYQ